MCPQKTVNNDEALTNSQVENNCLCDIVSVVVEVLLCLLILEIKTDLFPNGLTLLWTMCLDYANINGVFEQGLVSSGTFS